MYYMVGVAGTEIGKAVPDVNITQVTTGGSTENAKRLIKGELDMGIVYGSHVYMSLQQTGPFQNDDKGTMLGGVAMAYEGPTYFVTLGDSGIKTLADLAGKKVALGPPGSGTVFNCSNILTALGMLDKITPQMMTFADAGRALGNGQIDVFCQSSAPAAAVTELAETREILVLPYEDAQLAKIAEMFPFYHTGTMAKTIYKGVPETKMPYTTVYWVAHERVAADVVQKIVAAAYEKQDALAKGHKAWAQMKPDIENFKLSARRSIQAPRPITRKRGLGRTELVAPPSPGASRRPLPEVERMSFTAKGHDPRERSRRRRVGEGEPSAA